jgi:hypothetical protein
VPPAGRREPQHRPGTDFFDFLNFFRQKIGKNGVFVSKQS